MPKPLPVRLICFLRNVAVTFGTGLCATAGTAAWGVELPSFGDDARGAWQEETSALSAPLEIQGTILPNVAAGAAAAQGVPPGQAGISFNQTQHIDITQWLTPATSGAWGQLGLSLGLSAPGPGAGATPLANGSMPPASLDWGMRWRSRLDGGRHLDIAAWARAPQWSQPQDAMGLIWQSQQPVYGTRVEVQWASSRTRGLVPEFGAIGVQLQGGSRLVLRARKGGPMLYYRARF